MPDDPQTAALPEPIVTEYLYTEVLVDDGIAYVAGHLPKTADGLLHTGRCGEAVTLDQAKDAGRLAVRQALAWVDRRVGGLGRIRKVLRLNVYVAVAGDFCSMSEVAEVISLELSQRIGDGARHPRSVLGVARLPRNAPVMLDLELALHA